MLNFDYYNPVKVIFGRNRLEEIDHLVPLNARVLIVYGGGSAKRSGLIDRIRENLGPREILEFGGIEPKPRYETCMKAMEVVRREKVDFLMAVGGGSVIDGTKFISIGSYFEGDPGELLSQGIASMEQKTMKKIGDIIPYGAVITLPASGSEMNNGACITYRGGKPLVYSDFIYAKFAVIDPELTFTLPQKQVINGVVDTFSHVAENYFTFPLGAKVQDRLQEGVFETLIEIGKKTVESPTDYEARANLVWCATIALNGFINSGVNHDGTTHMIGLELTVLYGIDHGTTTGILLPAVLEVRREQKREKLLQYAQRVWHIDYGTEDEKISLAIQKTRDFFEDLGMDTNLSHYGVTKRNIPEILQKLEEHGMTAISERHDLGLEVSRKILERAMW